MKKDLFKKLTSKQWLERITQMARNGLSMDQIAKNCGVAKQTLYKYARLSKELNDAIDNGRACADFEVENALYKNATGFYIDEEYADSDGNVKTYKKYVPPNVVAQIFWLKNRKPKQWREKQEIELEAKERVQLTIKNDL